MFGSLRRHAERFWALVESSLNDCYGEDESVEEWSDRELAQFRHPEHDLALRTHLRAVR